jgi:hypothetical protein
VLHGNIEHQAVNDEIGRKDYQPNAGGNQIEQPNWKQDIV